MNNDANEELVKKYRLAGKIRFISFSLLFFFLLLLKSVGGYSYLSAAFIALILVEAVLNQPYGFIIRRVSPYHFQYYQMAVDIIAISWILHYMGGIEAPLVSIAYYAVILWAGVVSTTQAVFFATTVSAFFFSSIIICEHFGILPFISYYDYKIPTAQMFSVVLGNVSFLFAFGYFSAHSSRVIQSLERKRQEESLRNVHRLSSTGYLVGNTVHDTLNYIASIKGYARILKDAKTIGNDEKEMLESIGKMGDKSYDLLGSLARFSKKKKNIHETTDIHENIEEALKLTWPFMRYSNVILDKIFDREVPLVMADKDELHEVFVALILNTLDATEKEGKLTIKTSFLKEENTVEITFSDTGKGIKPEDLKRISEPFFTTKDSKEGAGLGLTTVYGIIARHKGKIKVESEVGKGTIFTIHLPVK